MKKYSTALAIAVCAALSPSANADDTAALGQQVQSLQDSIAKQQTQLENLKAELERLRQKEQAMEHAKEQENSSASNVPSTPDKRADQPQLSFTNNRAKITSADGNSSIALRALVQADAAHYAQDDAGSLSSDFRRGSVGGTPNRENGAARDLSDGVYFRRARLGVEGTIARDFSYRLILELGGSGTEGPTRINDAWIAYRGFAPLTIQFGAFSPAANMDDGVSPEDSLFIERASSAEISRSLGGADGRTSLAFRSGGARWMGSLALTGRTVGDAEVNDSQSAIVGRTAFLVMHSADFNLHLGASGTYVRHPADQGVDASGARYGIRFRERPELRIDDTRLIDTGTIDAQHAYAVGAEAAGNWRNWYAQGEHFWYGIDRGPATSTLSNPKFSGYYLQTSWTITGESHRYNMATGSYQNPKPARPFGADHGMGAWELALRYSNIDLNSDAGVVGAAAPTDGVRGGEQNIWTLGVNWYLNQNLRFLLDFQHVNVDRLNPAGPGNLTPFGASPATPPIGVQIGQSYNAFALRSQFSF